MTQLTNTSFTSTYGDLLTTTNQGQGLSNVLQQLQDGLGNASPISISTIAVNFNRTAGQTFQLDGIPITASATNINSVCNPNAVFSGLGGVQIPRGPTSQRINIRGVFRYNTDTDTFEGFNGAWITF